MKKQLFLLIATDAWHTRASEEIQGIFTSRKKLISAIDKNKYKLTEDDINMLNTHNQTQGLETNYQIKELPINTLL